jgi:hypothetical protein
LLIYDGGFWFNVNVSTVVDFVVVSQTSRLCSYGFRIGCSDFRPRCLSILAYTFYRAACNVFNLDVFVECEGDKMSKTSLF